MAPWTADNPDDDEWDVPSSKVPQPSKRQKRTHARLRGAEIRKVRIRSKDIYTGDVPMARLEGKLLSGEGFGEIHAWIVLDFQLEDMVAGYAQPERMKINMFGLNHNWTPDARFQRKDDDRPLMVEVKPLKSVQPGEDTPPQLAAAMRARLQAWATAADDACRDFLLLTEHEIYMEPRFHNAKMMLRAHGAQITEQMVIDAIEGLHDLDQVSTVEELAQAVPQHDGSMLLIACLLDWQGHIRLDRAEFFTPEVEFENYLSALPAAFPLEETR